MIDWCDDLPEKDESWYECCGCGWEGADAYIFEYGMLVCPECGELIDL
jgi:predicted RNA-binding Zn-ribbon protein involved in translation (DUF1610 family)